MPSLENSSVSFRRAPFDARPHALELFARKIQRDVTRGRPFDCLVTGDAEMRRLNLKFRGKDYPTDVLSFPSGAGLQTCPGQTARSAPLGDIVISLARARAQSREFGHSTENEIRILMLHGALHLAGFDHEADSGRMARAEKRWRVRLRLPGGLIERAHV